VVLAFETIIKNAGSLNQYEVIELGSGNAVRLRDFAELVRSIAGATTVLNIGATPYRKGEQMYSVADLSRMNEFGWNPKYSLRSGIGRVFKN
jgi:nucleoside-diphosphate-sugar epimerase